MSNGERRETIARARGRYAFEYVPIGSRIGSRPVGWLPPIACPVRSRRRTPPDRSHLERPSQPDACSVVPGPMHDSEGPNRSRSTVTAATISRLPVPRKTSSACTAFPAGGADARLRDHIRRAVGPAEQLQINGARTTILAHRGPLGFGTPGPSTGARTLTVEAIRELQKLIAPFDVRYGNFAGGLVNAVTRSGWNQWQESVSAYFENQALTGKDPTGARAEDFSTRSSPRPWRPDCSGSRGVLPGYRSAATFRGIARALHRDRHDRWPRLDGIGVRRATIKRFQHPPEQLSRGSWLDRISAVLEIPPQTHSGS